MAIKLSTLSIVLGLCLAAINLFGLLKPLDFKNFIRKLPRSLPGRLCAHALGHGLVYVECQPRIALGF